MLCTPISRVPACSDTSASLLNVSRVGPSPEVPMPRVWARKVTLAGVPSMTAASMNNDPPASSCRLPPVGARMRPLTNRPSLDSSRRLLPADASISTAPVPSRTP